MRKKLTQTVFFLSLACAVLLTAGCTPSAAKMIPSDFQIKNKHPRTVCTEVGGSWEEFLTAGQDGSAFSTGVITPQAYKEALDKTLMNSQLFTQILETGSAEYALKVTFQKKTVPYGGVDMKASIQTEWTLTKRGDTVPMWKKTILSSYTAKALEAFSGFERQAKSFEGAVRENIKEGIQSISEIDLS